MRIFLIILIVALCFSPTSAQQPTYHLREPDVSEYLTTILNLKDQIDDRLRTPILVEVHDIYAEELSSIDHSTLVTVFNVLYPTTADYNFLPYQNEWEQARLLSWLRENEIDLNQSEQLIFDDYDIQIIAVDFNNDGRNEFIVDLVRGCPIDSGCRLDTFHLESADYHEYLVVGQDEISNYNIIPTPLPWLSSHYHYSWTPTGSLFPVQLEDINQDGLPEWQIIAISSPGRNYIDLRLYVLGERDGQLVDLAAKPIIYRDYSGIPSIDRVWSIEISSVDPAIIVQRVKIADNWLCEREEVTKYSWDGHLYQVAEVKVYFPESFPCLMRLAEASMYDDNLAMAIQYYEQALTLDEQADYSTYTRFRLAIAHAMTGEPEIAVDELRLLQSDEQISRLVNNVLNAYSITPSVESICLSAYNFFVQEPFYISSQFYVLPGRIEENTPLFQQPYVEDPPAMSGCDVDTLLNKTLSEQTFTTTQSPAEQLEQSGWTIHTTFSADFNDDQINEWLIWLDSEMLHPVLFVSADDHYEASRFIEPSSYPHLPGELYEFNTVELPNQAGNTLVTLDRILTHPYLSRINRDIGGGPQCPQSNSYGELKMWRLVDDKLVEFFATLICEGGDIVDFVQGDIVSGWIPDGINLVPQTYLWSNSARTYSLSPVPDTPSVTQAIPEGLHPVDIDSLLWQVRNDYENGNLSTALEIIDPLLQANRELKTDEIQVIHYYRALVLEALDHPDEALTEYIYVYETAPDSAWGELAKLHLEIE